MIILKMRLITDPFCLSPALKVLTLETSCVCPIYHTHLTAFQEQSTTQTSLLEGAETVIVQNMKSGSRVVLVKGVAWKTYA
jgi:hypothetical protein